MVSRSLFVLSALLFANAAHAQTTDTLFRDGFEAGDIPATDVYTDEQTMAWIMDKISMIRGHTELGVVTGKPISLGGSQGRSEATARGCLYALRAA